MTGTLLIMILGLAASAPDTPEAAFERYKETINLHDFSRLAENVIASDAIFHFSGERHSGLAEVRDAFERTWSILPDEIYTMDQPEWIVREQDHALLSFRYRYAGTTPSGEKLSGGGHGTNLYRRTHLGWRLAYEHLSHDQLASK